MSNRLEKAQNGNGQALKQVGMNARSAPASRLGFLVGAATTAAVQPDRITLYSARTRRPRVLSPHDFSEPAAQEVGADRLVKHGEAAGGDLGDALLGGVAGENQRRN